MNSYACLTISSCQQAYHCLPQTVRDLLPQAAMAAVQPAGFITQILVQVIVGNRLTPPSDSLKLDINGRGFLSQKIMVIFRRS